MDKKPVVPQFVADFISSEQRSCSALSEAIDNMDMRDEGEVTSWFYDNSETFAKAWLFGYEVKKEKLYEVFLKRTGAQLGVCVPHGEDKTQFTKVELQEYNFDNLDVYEVEEVEE